MLQLKAWVWVGLVTVLSAVSVKNLVPLLVSSGVRIGRDAGLLLALQTPLAIGWMGTCSACAQAKGYRVREWMLTLIPIAGSITIGLMPVWGRFSHEVGGRMIYTHEFVLANAVLGLAGALGLIVVALLPDRWVGSLGTESC